MNKDIMKMIETGLKKNLKVTVLSNAMKPLAKHHENIKRLALTDLNTMKASW